MGKRLPFVISEGPEFEVEEGITRFERKAVTLGGLNVGVYASNGRGTIKDLPAKVFKLGRGDDSATIRHMGTMIKDKDNGASLCFCKGTGLG
jgi:hypothetical protein